jgi:hypothetical protein
MVDVSAGDENGGVLNMKKAEKTLETLKQMPAQRGSFR